MKGQYLKVGAEHSCPTPGTDLFKVFLEVFNFLEFSE